MQIRVLQESELELLFHYSSLEKWDMQELETKALFSVHQNDFFVAFLEEELLGFIVAIKYNEKLGFISSFLVLQKFRSLGYGKILFSHALKHLDGYQIALDSIIGQESFYRQFSFEEYFDVSIYAFEIGSMKLDFLSLDIYKTKDNILTKNARESQKRLFLQDEVLCKSILKDNEESSYAYMFPYLNAYKIEINSTDINETLALYIALTKNLQDGTTVYIKVDVLSPVLLSITKVLNMKLHYKYTRMYNKIL